MWILLILILLNDFYQNIVSYSTAKCYYSTYNSHPNHIRCSSRVCDKYLSVSIKKIRRLLLATASKNGNNIYNEDDLTGTSKEFKLSTTNIDTDITNEIKVIQNRIDDKTEEQKLVQNKINKIIKEIEDPKLSENDKKILLEDKRWLEKKKLMIQKIKPLLLQELVLLERRETGTDIFT